MIKDELFLKIQNLSIKEEEIDRFPPEIDELSLILSQELQNELSNNFYNIKLTIHEWLKLRNILQSKLANTIRRVKFTPPTYPGFEE